jgi:hypothetical protein
VPGADRGRPLAVALEALPRRGALLALAKESLPALLRSQRALW